MTSNVATRTDKHQEQAAPTSPWWKKAVVYQIYPRSFMDSNGDGIGDLGGILAKLDYLKYLGVDVLWLSPVYKSPNDDNGYDISEYRTIMDEFGTMEDFDELLKQAHHRGLRIVMDLVVNHTSDEHPWFVASRASRENPYREYYIWRNEPNVWQSAFGGSAWEYDEQTEAYYLHLFSKKQPDLNWESLQLRNEIYEMMRYWLDKGIDGFRMDVINFISKDWSVLHGENAGFVNGPRIHEFLREMNQRVLSGFDVMTVGETPGVAPDDAVLFTGEARAELNMIFQFEHMGLDSGPDSKFDVVPWTLGDIKAVMSKWQNVLYEEGWNSLYLNNHDQPRMVSRFGDDTIYRSESAKMLATFLHMQQGTPFIYQGEEIGMTNVRFPSIDDYRDIETLNLWKERVIQGESLPQDVLASIHAKGRDNARTPMQWDDSANAGFTEGEPWIHVNDNYHEINAQRELNNPDSILHYYRRLIQLRKQHDVITYGKYELLLPEHPEIYAYTRSLGDQTLLVICNFFAGTPEFSFPTQTSEASQSFLDPTRPEPLVHTELLISNYDVKPEESVVHFRMRPYETRVYRMLLDNHRNEAEE